MNNERLVFSITDSELQFIALDRIGRELDDDELDTAIKGLEYGILTGIDIVYSTIFNEMIPDDAN